MDFGLYEMKIVRNNPSSVKSDPRLTRTNDLSPLGSDLSEVYCIFSAPIYGGTFRININSSSTLDRSLESPPAKNRC